MKIVRVMALGALVVMLAIGAIACSDDDDDGGDEPQASATTESGTAGSPTASGTTASPTVSGGSEDGLTITATDFSFSPAALTIDGATDNTITLNNTGDAPHTINIYYDAGYTDALADTGNVSPGTSSQVTVESNSVEEAPELFFRCNIHPQQMEGRITVELGP